jgi:hypothetical protein
MQNDVRLIDANALLKEIEDWHDSLGGTMNPADWGIQNVLQSVMDYIIEAEDVDAVPVVRCRECKYAEKTVWSSGEMYCRVWKMNPRPDGFCHMGAKMDAKDMDVPTKDGGAD